MNTGLFKLYASPPWCHEYRKYRCPVSIRLHTRRIYFEWRPFSGFAQGGDVRGMTDFRGYRKECKWVLQDQSPEIWAALEKMRDGRLVTR